MRTATAGDPRTLRGVASQSMRVFLIVSISSFSVVMFARSSSHRLGSSLRESRATFPWANCYDGCFNVLEAAPIGWKLFVLGISLDAQTAVSLFIVTLASRLLARLYVFSVRWNTT